ncbi:hypothetical protein BOSE127_80042 [Bosea sp. 127]|nr:hypothetical protein BOSE127_80042 [Bosea sp. 127]
METAPDPRRALNDFVRTMKIEPNF